MARIVLTNAEMQALINAGQDVLYKGRTIKNIADLPSDAQILIDYPEYAYNRIEGNAKGILGYEIYGTPSDGNTLVWSNTNKRWEFAAGGGGGGTPGGSNKQIQVNSSGTFAGAVGFEYDATADWTLKQTPASGKTGLLIHEPLSTAPATIGGFPVLTHLHNKASSLYYQLGFSDQTEDVQIANYIANGALWFDTYTPSNYAQSAILSYGGFTFYSGAAINYGGIYQVSDTDFAVGIVDNTLTIGLNRDRFIFRSEGVSLYTPATAMVDGSVATSHLHFYLDETSDLLRAKWKESGGTVFNRTLAFTDFAQTWTALQTLQTNSIGTTTTDGLVLQNLTAAAVGAQQNSPFLRLRGYGWKTDATAESRPIDMGWQVVPQQAGANPLGELVLKYSVNGVAYTTGVGFLTSGFTRFAQSNSTNFSLSMFGGGDFSNGVCGWQNPGNNNVWSLVCPPSGPIAVRFSRGGAGYYTRIDLLNSNATSLQLGTGQANTSPFAFTTNYFTFDTSNVMLIAHQPLRLDSWGVFTEISAPATPAANTARLYAKDSGGVAKLAYKDDAGTEYELGTAVPEINTSGLGYSIPGQGGTVFLGDTSTQVVGSANQVRVILFYIDRKITVDRIGLNGVVDQASQNAAFAIYSVDGNTKIADSGAISTAAWSGAANYAISGTATFGPGYYYFAWTASSTTPTIRSASAATNYYAPLNNGTGTVIGTAANASSAGVMPATLGTITDDATLAVPIVRWFKN